MEFIITYGHSWYKHLKSDILCDCVKIKTIQHGDWYNQRLGIKPSGMGMPGLVGIHHVYTVYTYVYIYINIYIHVGYRRCIGGISVILWKICMYIYNHIYVYNMNCYDILEKEKPWNNKDLYSLVIGIDDTIYWYTVLPLQK